MAVYWSPSADHSPLLSLGRDATGAEPTRLVVGAGQAADDHSAPLVLGVDELAVADVDADVREAPSEGVLEEDQVARPQITPRHGSAGDRLAPGAGADIEVEGLERHVIGETGAVKGVRPVRRPDVGIAE